jgi:sulfatase modifying factor 1
MPSASSAAAGGYNNSGFELVQIPGGWFLMGCDTGQDNEKPVHRVWVDEFLLAARQVTNADYGRFLRDSASRHGPPPFWSDPAFNHPEQPVVGVSWFEAIRYCEWLRASTGGEFRLPTEAEWERAARGGRKSGLYPWGDALPQSLPGYADRSAGHWQTGPEPVGRAESNPYGLYNMCDNVHEWCSDWYAADYYAVSPERNPCGPETGERRASRGGSWRHHVKMSRCAARSSIPPEFKYADYGFRVACDVQCRSGVRGPIAEVQPPTE